MPSLKLSDQDGKALLSTNLHAGSGLGRYLKPVTELRASLKLANALKRPLSNVGEQGRELDLSLADDLPVGGSALTLDAGAHAAINIHPSGSALFDADDLREAVVVPNGLSYVALSLAARIKAGLEGERGTLSFGFQAGTGLEYRFLFPVELASSDPLLGVAIGKMFSAAVIPADVSDLAAMPVGSHALLAGDGEIEISGEVALSAVSNVLATPGLPLIGGLKVSQAASVSVGATWSASGAIELRITKTGTNQVRIAYHRRRGTGLAVGAKASLGVSATVRDSDVLKLLFKALSADPEADLMALVGADLDDEQIAAIQEAIAASVDRSMRLAAELQLSSRREGQALFAYDVNLDALNEEDRTAVADALHGRLTGLERLAAASGGAVNLAGSGAARLRERKVSWRINLFGALNAASLVDLVRSGTVTFDPVSGSLNAADQITSKRILVKTRPLESDTEKVRRVVFESLIVTAAYQCSRTVNALDLTASHTYVEQHGRTRREEMTSHYDAIVALGLCDEAERDRRLGSAIDFGPSTLMLECRLDRDACDALFFDRSGKPRARESYEHIARQAFLALIPADDPERSFRRGPLERDAAFDQMKRLGQASLAQALPDHIAHNAARLGAVTSDYSTIVWWATAMEKAGKALVAARQFMDTHTAVAGDTPQFRKVRAQLEDALARVVVTTEARWGDPWDILALDAASAQAADARAIIVSPHLSAAYGEPARIDTEGVALESIPGTDLPAARGVRAATRGDRQLSEDQRETLRRHVVNLRGGDFSTSGAFTSAEADVRRIFTEHLPAELAERRAAGERLRVVFYAHGGLTEEIDGLLAAASTIRFWRSNKIYPVFFVWETGIKETLHDIVTNLVDLTPRTARGTRSPLTDAVIEAAAREGGQAVWSQMKKSAAQAVRSGGGARTVAALARDLWAESAGDLEVHALGHSAGAIFHSHFLPVLLEQSTTAESPVEVQSLHLLAPAVTTTLFKSALKDLVGAGKGIRRLTMYTMNDDLEKIDPSTHPYGKSLLYLVSGAFEAERNEPILGLERSLKRDVDLIRFFGLAGPRKEADVLFSKTPAGTALRNRSESTTHGGFDNDVATMTSLVRRVLDVPDTTSVVDYFQDAVEGRQPARTTSLVEAVERGSPAARMTLPRQQRPAATPKKPWTVLVWLAGDNNLESFALTDLEEMKRVGSSDQLNIVAQLDTMADDRTRRYFLRRGTPVEDDAVEEVGETNTGDPAVAIDFFVWAMQRYPSERVLAVIWNHGSGIDEADVYARAAARGVSLGRGSASRAGGAAPAGNVRTMMSRRYRRALFSTTLDAAMNNRAIAYDDSSRDFLDNAELKRVLEQVNSETGRAIDLLGFDACLMNMLEIAYQLRTTARFIVGSEEIEPGDGWPYDKVLADLAARPKLSAAELGAVIVKRYAASYTSESVTQSLLDLDRVGTCAVAVDALAAALIKALKTASEYAAVAKALNATLRFDMEEFVDLGHLCSELAARSKNAAVKKAAKAVLAAISGPEGLVAAEAHKGRKLNKALGVAIYAPRGAAARTYSKLDFAKATKWGEFLDAYTNA